MVGQRMILSRRFFHIATGLKVLLAAVILSYSETALCQPMLYFRNLDVHDGLTSNRISSFAQDDQGFIWIGTHDGLVRFDGLSSKKYFHDPSDPSSLGSNFIAWNISVDSKGRTWATLHGNGFTCYDPTSRRFHNFNYANGQVPAEWANHTQDILFTPNGQTLVFCNQGLVTLNQSDKVSSSFFLPDHPDLADIGHIRMASFHKKEVWVATFLGLARYNVESGSWEHQRNDIQNTAVFRNNWGIHGAEYIDGTIWFSTYFKPKNAEHRFLYSFNIDENRLDSVPITPDEFKKNPFSDQIHTIVKDEKGMLWLGSEGLGLLRYDPKTEQWTRCNGSDEWDGAMLPGPINRLFIDRDQNLWIGLKSGISIMAPERQYFKNYSALVDEAGKPIELSGIQTMIVDSMDGIWLGKIGEGLIHLNREKQIEEQINTLYPSQNEYNDYLDVRYADSQCIIANVWYEGIAKMDRKSGKAVRTKDFTPKGKPELRNILRTRSGQLYGFGWEQFGKLSFEEKTFTGFTTPLNNSGIPDLVWAAVEDDNGMIWLGMGQRGLLCVDPDSLKVVGGWERDTAKYPMTGVYKMVHTGGRIYFSLANQGMGIYNISDRSVVSYSKKDGLCSDEIGGFVKDKAGDIWAFSGSGLSWFDQENDRFKSFDQADGMVSEKVNDAALLSNGNILMITEGGLIEFDPEVVKAFSPTYSPFVKSIRVYDQDLLVSDLLDDGSTITVPHQGNYLRVEFSALEFIDPEKVKFAYRLEGAEDNWNYSDHRPLAIYTNMAGGNYKLCAKCQNTDGVWGKELCIPVFVTTPFYRKAWFVGLIFIVLSCISFFIYRWQLKKKLAVLEVRNRLSRDLHDDIGSALSSINIYSAVAKQQLDDKPAETKKLLDRMGASARGMMQSMDDIIWAIDPNNDSAKNLISRMREFGSPILETQNINFNLDVDDKVADLKLSMVTRRNLFLIFKEAVNNAAKYSKAKNLKLSIGYSSSKLNFKFEDDGKGFDAEAESSRHGLKNMKQRVQEMGGSLTIHSTKETGTRIEFQIAVT